MQELDIKKYFHYDHTDEASIMARARMLKGKTLGYVYENTPYDEEKENPKDKGNIGNFIQKNWFGIPKNNSPEPDFEEAGIELKACPIKKITDKKLKTRELKTDQRTKICSINYMALYKENWESSHAKKKLNKVLFVFHERKESDEDMRDKKVLDVALWELSKQDRIDVIMNDWSIAFDMNFNGKSHELSERFFDILSTSRATGGKTIDGVKDLVEQPIQTYSRYAKKRAFSLKQGFTNQFWKELRKPNNFESIVDTLNISKTDDYETTLINSITKYKGKTIGEISNIFNIPVPIGKAAVATIIKMMIGFKSVKSKIKEFEQLGISVKTIPIKTSDNSLYEAISFPKFVIKEFTQENWDESTLSDYLNRILFIPVSREKRKGIDIKDRVLEKPFFWSPSTKEIEIIKREWESYKKQASQKLNIYRKPWKNKKGYVEQITNLSNETETEAIHIRPHGIDSDDRDEDNFGTSVVKQSFWLNKEFVYKLIQDS